MAGVAREDIGTCQIYDCYTYTVLVTLEDYGFCAKGEGGPFVADGKLGPGGSLPTNTGGGQLSGILHVGVHAAVGGGGAGARPGRRTAGAAQRLCAGERQRGDFELSFHDDIEPARLRAEEGKKGRGSAPHPAVPSCAQA